MKTRWMMVVGVAWLAGIAQAEPEGAATRLAPGVRLEVAGKPIDVAVGHAAPFVADWDGDGRADLLVGEFGGGRLHVFRASGGAGAPTLAAPTYVQADGQDASVPSG